VGSNLWPPDPQSDTTVVVAVRALPLQQRLVVDGGLQEGGGHAKLGEERVRFTLGVEMGDLVVAVGPAESLTQAALVIEVCLHDFSTI
jgi:hypothetical protein